MMERFRQEIHQGLARLEAQAQASEKQILAERSLQTRWSVRLHRMLAGNVALAMVVACAAWALFGMEVAVVAASVMAIVGCVLVAVYVERRVAIEHRALGVPEDPK